MMHRLARVAGGSVLLASVVGLPGMVSSRPYGSVDTHGVAATRRGPPRPPAWEPRTRPPLSRRTEAGIVARRDETAPPASARGRTEAPPVAGTRGRWSDRARGRQGAPHRTRR